MQYAQSQTTVPRVSPTRALERLLRWVVQRDAAYRQATHIDRLSPHLRRDAGLPLPLQVPQPQRILFW